MQPKSLCFFNTNRPWGGGEHWHLENALLARDKGYRVSVVANKGSELARRLKGEPGIRLFTPSLGGLAWLNPIALLRLARFFRQEAVDAVLLCLPRDVKAGGVAAKLAGVPDIIYRRGIAVPVRNRLTNRLLYGHVLTKLIVNSLASSPPSASTSYTTASTWRASTRGKARPWCRAAVARSSSATPEG
jgi:hypothetical protein